MERVIKSIALTPAVAAELDRQAEQFGLNTSAYIRVLVAFVRDNGAMYLRYDECGNRMELDLPRVYEKDTHTLI